MSQKNNSIQKSAKALLLSIGLTITLISCGGGGGGGSAYPNIQYSGVNTQATITDANASDFPVAILEGSTRSDSANTLSIISESPTPTSEKFQRSTLLKSGADIIKNTIVSTLSDNGAGQSVIAVTESLNGTLPDPRYLHRYR